MGRLARSLLWTLMTPPFAAVAGGAGVEQECSHGEWPRGEVMSTYWWRER